MIIEPMLSTKGTLKHVGMEWRSIETLKLVGKKLASGKINLIVRNCMNFHVTIPSMRRMGFPSDQRL